MNEKGQETLHNTIAKFFDPQLAGDDLTPITSKPINDTNREKKAGKTSGQTFTLQDVMELTLLHAEQMRLLNAEYE